MSSETGQRHYLRYSNHNVMGLLTIGFRNKALDIRYSKHPQPGFYLATGEADVAQNCKALGIDLDNDEEWSGPHSLKEFDTFFVYTSQVFGKRVQHIILDSASEGDVVAFAAKKPKKVAQRIFNRLGIDGPVIYLTDF